MTSRATRRRAAPGSNEKRSRRATIPAITALALMVIGCAHRPAERSSEIAPDRGGRAGTLRIYLARHGQTDWNATHRLQGSIDVPLNATGRAQAQALAEALRGVRIDRVYSSTLARSRETAEIARGEAPLESLDGLREQRMGKFEGVRLDSDSVVTAEYDRRSVDPDDALDGGESLNQHLERVRAAMDAILARHPSGSILIIGHGGTNKLVLRALLGLTLEQTRAFSQANDELYLIEIEPGGRPRLWKRVTESNLKDL
jgi:probable phosphoglycerate mutase